VSDAPPKLYASRYFELTPLQRRVYDDLREKYVTEVEGSEVRAANVLLRMTRLQMICRGYYPPERTGEACASCAGEGWLDDGECPACDGLGVVVRVSELRRIDPKSNPAIDALVEELKVASGPTVVWARFRQDVLDVCEATRADGRNFFRYDGGVPEAEREKSYQAFRNGDGDGIVATIGSGLQRGKDLSRARTIIYYSNDFALRSRQQSEDRAEGLGRNFSTDVVDLVAADTRDLQVIDALRAKRSIAELIMGDPPSTWI
jgi:SNF2 family DNA or RNA helicase